MKEFCEVSGATLDKKTDPMQEALNALENYLGLIDSNMRLISDALQMIIKRIEKLEGEHER